MMLKDLMEEKQLNFNQPLLSVRKFSSTMVSEANYKRESDNSLAKFPPPPANKSELKKSGPVRNAGTVPFVWEKIPGKPKDETKSQISALENPSIIKNPPPGKISKNKRQDSDAVSKVTDIRTGSTVFDSESIASLLKEETQENESSDSDEAYVDALDTLSRTESFFIRCSVSSLSGCDDEEVQPVECFSSNRKGRDFMIDRFLPASKAMTSETISQYASKKALVGQEQQKQIKEVVNTERSCSLNKHRSKALLPYTLLDIGRKESDDKDEDEKNQPTACGLFPRFCLMNPIPGLRMEDKVQSSAVHGMQTKSAASHIETTKRHAKTSYHGKKLVDSQSGFTEERENFDIPVKSKHGSQCESSKESPVVEKTLYVDSIHKAKSQTNHMDVDLETLRKESAIYKNPSTNSSFGNSKHLDFVDVKEASKSKSLGSLDLPFLICSENYNKEISQMANHCKKIDSKKQGLTNLRNQGSCLDQDLAAISSSKAVQSKRIDLESQVKRNSDILTTQDSEVGLKIQRGAKLVDQECALQGGGKIDLESECLSKLGQKVTSKSYSELPLILPSLKAPSDSWLKRTLATTISSGNITSRSNLAAANVYAPSKDHNTASLGPKCIVFESF